MGLKGAQNWVRDEDKVGVSSSPEEPAWGTLNVVQKVNVGMRRFCSVGKALLALPGGKVKKTVEKQEAVLLRNFVTATSPGLSEGN